ncbi:MAG: orotidine 5'-phosphate decarboxylase / HUMPS family protein [Bacilli bacterium]
MKLQLALDRMTLDSAVAVACSTAESVDWVEMGTSLIKEFGMQSILALRRALPDKTIVADVKTMDNARYEFELCFRAGADVATLMAVAPAAAIESGIEIASEYGKTVILDLLNCPVEHIGRYANRENVILCWHLGKDEQENARPRTDVFTHAALNHPASRWAFAGGLSLENAHQAIASRPHLLIVGSAITSARDPALAAHKFRMLIQGVEA